MGYEKKRKQKGFAAAEREHAFIKALSDYSSNLYRSLIKDTLYTSYLKLLKRDDDTWLALLGVWTNEGLPVVFFGNGRTVMDALQSLTGAMASNKHRADKYGFPAPFLGTS